jgi:hypothetical protein
MLNPRADPVPDGGRASGAMGAHRHAGDRRIAFLRMTLAGVHPWTGRRGTPPSHAGCAKALVASVAALCSTAIATSPAHACGAAKRAKAQAHNERQGRPPLVIGDSTMIFAAPVLGRLGLEADARGCRQFAEGIAILAARRHAKALPATAILALGANGPISGTQIAAALRITGSQRILGLVTPRKSNASALQMRRAAKRQPDRVLLIDWVAFSASHATWFAGDGLHVNGAGATAYARLIRRAVAPFAFPPVRLLHLPRRARGAKRCGLVHRGGQPLRVYAVRGRARVACVRARALARRPPLLPTNNWQTYDWRRTHDGPWSWVYARRDRKVIVATVRDRSSAPTRTVRSLRSR